MLNSTSRGHVRVSTDAKRKTTQTNMRIKTKKQKIGNLNQIMLSTFKHRLLTIIVLIIIMIKLIMEFFPTTLAYCKQTLQYITNTRTGPHLIGANNMAIANV
jgi:hypothetical protein